MSQKIKNILIKSLPAIISSSLLAVAVIFAFSEPSQTPPQGNVPAPINVGSSAQIKGGPLQVNGFRNIGTTILDGNVGIGTTAPVAKLDVVNGGQRIQFLTGTNSSNYTLSIGVNDNGVNIANNSLIRGFNFGNANGTLLTITSSGNVGIGTTAPGYKLDVAGALRLQPSSVPTGSNGVIYYDSTANKFKCYENGAWTDCISAGGGALWAASGSNIYNTNTGNVGIGTTAPTGKLSVVVPANSNGIGVFTATAGDTHLPWYDNWNYISGNGVIFRNASNVEKVKIDARTGDVAIGKTKYIGAGAIIGPGGNLETEGLAIIGSQLSVSGGDPGNWCGGKGLRQWIGICPGGAQVPCSGKISGSYLHISGWTNPNYGLNVCGTDPSRVIGLFDHVVIPDGNVGIGTTAPTARLDVQGDIKSNGTRLYLTRTDGVGYFWINRGPDEGGAPLTNPEGDNVIGWNNASGFQGREVYILGTTIIGDMAPTRQPWAQHNLIVSGKVGINVVDPGADRLDVRGRAYASGGWQTTNADYAEWFEKEGDAKPGDLVGINLATGKVRKYQPGDRFIGIVSANSGIIGNRLRETEEEMSLDHLLVALLGQVEFDASQAHLEGRIVKTSDGQYVGVLLANGRVFLGR
jgi:hypothetical protein